MHIACQDCTAKNKDSDFLTYQAIRGSAAVSASLLRHKNPLFVSERRQITRNTDN
ncbi:hypothetical protein HMPREF3220_04544 [Citrobacter koseri]|nr:hypothetical protein HMPREF3220_04544 [Citrobacter koseri]KWZ98521.1 hypothetical protein HMPREF3207_04139 [Citrobacter koseri]